MIKQAENNIEHGYPAEHHASNGDASPSSDIYRPSKFAARKQSTSENINVIDEMMYKY